MKIYLIIFISYLLLPFYAQSNNNFYLAAMHQALGIIKSNHAYLIEKNIDWSCLESTYLKKAQTAKTSQEILSAFESLTLEFSDNHMMLNTNNNNSYRLYSTVVVQKQADDFYIYDLWKNNLIEHQNLAIGSKFLNLNGVKPDDIIDRFPTSCLDKTSIKNQTWIINKTLAGVYSQPRILELLSDGKSVMINLDKFKTKSHNTLLNHEIKDNIGIITINDSLGNTGLIAAFDLALNQMRETNGLVLDLRNTISGGDSYMARAIIGRLIDKPQAYQKHKFIEQRDGAVGVNRVWNEFVEPRGDIYNKPVIVLANQWTGSMGEGLTIGLQGMGRAKWIGTEMAGLLGSVNQFKLNGLWFSIQIPVEQLFRIDGVPRALVQPDVLLQPTASKNDGLLTHAIKSLQIQGQQR